MIFRQKMVEWNYIHLYFTITGCSKSINEKNIDSVDIPCSIPSIFFAFHSGVTREVEGGRPGWHHPGVTRQLEHISYAFPRKCTGWLSLTLSQQARCRSRSRHCMTCRPSSTVRGICQMNASWRLTLIDHYGRSNVFCRRPTVVCVTARSLTPVVRRATVIHSFIHSLYTKPTQTTVNAIQCKTAHWSPVHWQLQGYSLASKTQRHEVTHKKERNDKNKS